MNDFTDLFYTIFSIVIFSFLLLQANSLLLSNEEVTIDHEYEKTAISVAQSIIDEAKTRDFDINMSSSGIPGSFRETTQFGTNGIQREKFTAFDDYHVFLNDPLLVRTPLGDYDVTVLVEYVDTEPPFDVSTEKTMNKRMTVTATSTANNESATLVYVKSFFDY